MGDELRPDQAAMLDALKADTSHEAFKRVERLSDRVWKLVEDDEFDEQPHLYLIRGEDKLVLFDTGTGRADLHAFIRSGAMYDAGPAQPGGGDGVPPPLPLLVINSHCHFDHIGSNHRFSPAASGPVSGVSDLCMGGGARSFSEGYNSSDTSLGKSAGCEIQDFRFWTPFSRPFPDRFGPVFGVLVPVSGILGARRRNWRKSGKKRGKNGREMA